MAIGSYALYRCAILSTSTGSLDSILDRNSPIQILRLTVHTGSHSYADGLDLEPERFYQWMAQHPDTPPTTEPPSAQSLRNMFHYLHEQGYREAVITTLSSRLSTSAAIIRRVAAEMADMMAIYVVDTGLACMPEGFFALEALRLLQAGKTAAEVADYLEQLKPRGELLIGLSSLRQAAISGGFKRAGIAVSNLAVKPVFRFSNNQLTMLNDTYDNNALLDATVAAVAGRIEGRDRSGLVVGGMYGGNLDLYRQFAHKLHQKTGLHLQGIPITPVMGAYIGTDAIGVGIIERLPE
ncbi:DegV family protein [Uruburuella testudinis]|uniref:DegV family protein n=1 Tax=Uruburuella testudinis TaxID=1282863 RepID=A0ABY4DSA8_9NEIS|nr:DegV family protein [Uruburuella testudinis]UOO81919.1 DegV family protein [Uruburuella testudinis]